MERDYSGIGPARYVILAVFAVTLLNPSAVLATGFSIQTIDDPGTDVGLHNSLILDSAGQPHVAYWDFFFADLEYAVRVGGVWTKQTVDASGSSGQSPSIALNSLERPQIAYFETDDFDLRYAFFNGFTWTVELADTVGTVGAWPSLEMTSSDQPCISYNDFGNQDLLYIQKVAGIWTRERVDSVGSVGSNTSLALDPANRPHISYHDITNRDLKYATKFGGNWVIEVVDSADEVGAGTSIQLDSVGNPRIAYYDITNEQLKYASKIGGNWVIEAVPDLGQNLGTNLSLALDSAEVPHVSHYEPVLKDLFYSWKRNGTWFTEVVTSTGEVGGASSIAMDERDLPKISFYDFTNKSLRFAEGANPILVPSHYPTIQKGILFANEGDTVLVAAGLYQGPGNCQIGMHDYDFCLRSESGPQSTIIDCENNGSGFFAGSGNGPATVIEGFKIINANFAGIEVSSSLTIRNCIFGPSDGIGISVFGPDSNPIIEDCTFVDNTIDFSPGGAGILIERSRSTIVRNCTFDGNIAGGQFATISRGGGILCVNASPLIWGCTFRNNVAEEGGAIAYYENGVWPSTPGPKIDGCLIAGNLARNQGGGVWLLKANTWIDGTTISGNRANSRGGGVYFGFQDTVSVRRTILWDNCADVNGDEMSLASFIVDVEEIQISFECSDVDSLGFFGLGVIEYVADNIFVNPEFENPESCNNAPTDLGDYGLLCFSPCLPANSPCGQLIGAPEEFCPLVAVGDPFAAPSILQLQPAFPNPFSSQAVIQYDIPRASQVELRVFDLRGRLVRVLESSAKEPGRYTAHWDGRDESGSRVATGMYFYRLRTGEISETRSVLFLLSSQE